MKMRYTPYQIKCHYGSYDEASFYDKVRAFDNLGGMVVITGELHSMLAPTACCLKYMDNSLNVIYIMTDGGSLPMDFSFIVNELKAKSIISGTITCGNAFGGDLEAVNVYDALVFAKSVLECDIAIITMGPGVVGTNTKYGFSGIEQGGIIDCINTLKGQPVFLPRISFTDPRERHYGISHHTLTVLTEIVKTSSYMAFPIIEDKKMEYMKRQIMDSGINNKHKVYYVDSDCLFQSIQYYNLIPYTMGRTIENDKEFFMACASCAKLASTLFYGHAL
jgi:hypothetical protein